MKKGDKVQFETEGQTVRGEVIDPDAVPRRFHGRHADKENDDPVMLLVRVKRGKEKVGTWTKPDGRVRHKVPKPKRDGTWTETGEQEGYSDILIREDAVTAWT